MKLTYSQLAPHLAQTLAPIYLVSGDELILKNEALQLLRKTAKQAGFTERLRLTPGTNWDINQLYTTLYSASLLSEKRLIELDLRDIALPKAATELLQAYAKHPDPATILMLDMNKVDGKITKTAWYQALDKVGVSLAIWPINREQLPTWLRERAKKYKFSLSAEAARLLSDYVEGNLAAAAQALEKIYLLTLGQGQTSIDVNWVKTILEMESRFTLFDFIESLIAGETERSLHILDNLHMEGVEPVLILWAITRELRLLADLASQTEQGVALSTLFQQQRIFTTRQNAIRRFLTRHNAKNCWQLLLHAAEMDKLIKGAIVGDTWQSLRLFCLRI